MTDRCSHEGCTNPGVHYVTDRDDIAFCGDHLWKKTPVTESGHTCDMLGANPPSPDRCGRTAAVKWTMAVNGHTTYFCERCRRKHDPTEAEKAEDERRESESARTAELWNTFVFKPIGWAMGLGLLALVVYGVVAFIHWCWRNT
jgi:hypothetical protein